MHPKVERRTRRVHGAEIKSKVLAECRRPGASVSAVALAHGLNANLVRKWMQGRGLQRAGLKPDDGQMACAAPVPTPVDGATRLKFVPVQVPARSDSIEQVVYATSRCRRDTASPEAAVSDPWAYLRDVLARIHSHPASRIDELLPHRWQPS